MGSGKPRGQPDTNTDDTSTLNFEKDLPERPPWGETPREFPGNEEDNSWPRDGRGPDSFGMRGRGRGHQQFGRGRGFGMNWEGDEGFQGEDNFVSDQFHMARGRGRGNEMFGSRGFQEENFSDGQFGSGRGRGWDPNRIQGDQEAFPRGRGRGFFRGRGRGRGWGGNEMGEDDGFMQSGGREWGDNQMYEEGADTLDMPNIHPGMRGRGFARGDGRGRGFPRVRGRGGFDQGWGSDENYMEKKVDSQFQDSENFEIGFGGGGPPLRGRGIDRGRGMAYDRGRGMDRERGFDRGFGLDRGRGMRRGRGFERVQGAFDPGRGGGRGRGWYSDDMDAGPVTENEVFQPELPEKEPDFRPEPMVCFELQEIILPGFFFAELDGSHIENHSYIG